ncbi:molybdenum cofactor guanylyltransferase MobA [Cellvibrio sp. PSBB006]|uniref:molybdenum cofactor guanylyltransferase MobA n=1 Tax=Cellvibrio sp. PSBB006 TaxID=1987723 RepID=UPI000B3B9D46|nr:molybdenum cofactor guanylyltransferase MobA [Cellvibrio sp. PSBB006]ARU27313.1 molybdenum cofactor guanylyltransferase MobA [Cellvibrio sp. PSBB006]
MTDNNQLITGVILAGGLAKRMGGGDKCLLPLGGKTLLQRSIERAQPQVSELILNANGNSLRFARSRLPVIADLFANFPGPLAGIHAALTFMDERNPNNEWLASFACDTPFFPRDMVQQLLAAAGDSRLVVARSNGRVHPIFALWHASMLGKVEQRLQKGDAPRLQEWIEDFAPVYVDFSSASYDPFFNINTPQDLYSAEAQLIHVQ